MFWSLQSHFFPDRVVLRPIRTPANVEIVLPAHWPVDRANRSRHHVTEHRTFYWLSSVSWPVIYHLIGYQVSRDQWSIIWLDGETRYTWHCVVSEWLWRDSCISHDIMSSPVVWDCLVSVYWILVCMGLIGVPFLISYHMILKIADNHAFKCCLPSRFTSNFTI